MERRKKLPNGYWNNLDNCLAEARKYKTTTEWQKSSPLSYRWACNNQWLDKCSEHMSKLRKPDGYWTLERCKEAAKSYKTKVEWRAGNPASLTAAKRGGWFELCSAHMQSGGLWFGPSAIARALLSRDVLYLSEHRFKGSPEISRRPFDFYLPDYKLVIEFHGEQHLIGWGRRPHDAKAIQERDLFKQNWALENGINYLVIKQWEVSSADEIEAIVLSRLKEIAEIIGVDLVLKKRVLTESEEMIVQSRLKWTLGACAKEAKKHNSIKEWQIGSAGSYNAAFAKGWLDKCCTHMERKLFPKNYWTLEHCMQDARQYKTKSEWCSAKRSGYSIASKNGWLKKCTAHMHQDMRKIGIQRVWTFEKCLELARSCSSRADFKRASGSAYHRARVKGWLEECCAHMVKPT